MSHLSTWIHSPFAQALGWTLAHFVWEGALLAVILLAALRVLRHAPARRRYAIACLVLAAMPLAFAATLAVLWMRRPVAIAVPMRWVAMPVTVTPMPAPAPRFSWAGLLDRLAWLTPVWLIGVAFCYARGLAGWAAVRRLGRRGVCAPASEWQARLGELAARLRLSRPVALLESCLVDTPVLIGYLRPVILLPVGCLTGMPMAQVECILLHELAHVARHDYLVNMLQSLVEGLLFYHPAVWWVSHAVRAERENCCDDRVVELVGNARAYAATLAALEERRALAPQAALAVTGGSLMQRIRRLTAESRGSQNSVAPAFSAALLLIFFALALSALPGRLPQARHALTPARPAALLAQAPADNLPAPYQKWLTEEVTYIIKPEERAAFLALTTDAERADFIKQFWERRGEASRKEHYRRIAYANEHFGGKVEGWKTDRGHFYIQYGPPDGTGESSGATVWHYSHAAHAGDPVTVTFLEDRATGELSLRLELKPEEADAMPPLPNDATVFASKEPQGVTVIVPGKDQQVTPGVIGIGDILDVEYAMPSPPSTAIDPIAKLAECAALERKYTPEYPDVIACHDQLRVLHEKANSGEPATRQLNSLRKDATTIRSRIQLSVAQVLLMEQQLAEAHKKLEEARAAISASPEVIQKFNQLSMEIQLAKEEYTLLADKSQSADNNPAADPVKQAKEKLEAKQAELANFISQNQGSLPDNFQANTMNFNSLQSNIAKLSQHIQSERQSQILLESDLNNNMSMQAQVQAGNYDLVRQNNARVTVNDAGKIALQGMGYLTAAGLTPAQLASAIAPESTVRIVSSASKLVTVLVPLGGSSGGFHVFGEVRNGNGRVVQSFEEDASGQPAVAKWIPVAAGRYRLKVTVKNQTSGASHNSEVEFTVN